MRLMIVLHNVQLAHQTAAKLQAAGFGTDAYAGIDEAAEALSSAHYDLVLLERGLRDGDGLAWLRGDGCRKLAGTTFVILLADQEEERVAALEAGADDSAVRLVSIRELVARIRAVLRRPRQAMASTLEFSDLSLCTVERAVRVGDRLLPIQKRETAILEALIRRNGKVVPRPLLEHDIYGLQAEFCPNSLEVRISRIRRHLTEAGSSTKIETVRGVGYKLSEAEPKVAATPRPGASISAGAGRRTELIVALDRVIA
ncbi:MAG: winged helix-turn-helix domain-containing protein [Janthinobacterium lividum]